ncbi:MAG: hypothetical protein WAV56_05170, partial [Microgenomates group bacterium]
VKNVTEVRVIGSIGRKDGDLYSDMDVWFIFNILPRLDEMADISNRELSVREKLSQKFNLPNLNRHRCTIFTQKEAALYEQIFAVRVGMPRSLGETTILLGNGNQPIVSAPKADIIVSLKEFRELYERETARGHTYFLKKFVRRTLRETIFYHDGQRLTNNASVDEIIRDKYQDNDQKVLSVGREFSDHLRAKTKEESILFRDLAHHLMFTMEKFRWEIMYGITNNEEFDNWRLGISRRYTFYPQEMIDFVKEAAAELGVDPTEELEQIKMISDHKFSLGTAQKFHDFHTNWMLEKARLALKLSA